MASILKCNAIQLPDGSTPTAADLGIDVAGTVIAVKSIAPVVNVSFANSTSSRTEFYSVTFDVTQAGSKINFQASVPHYSPAGGTWGQAMIVALYLDGVFSYETEHVGPIVSMEYSSQIPVNHTFEGLAVGTYTVSMCGQCPIGTATQQIGRGRVMGITITEIAQ